MGSIDPFQCVLASLNKCISTILYIYYTTLFTEYLYYINDITIFYVFYDCIYCMTVIDILNNYIVSLNSTE